MVNNYGERLAEALRLSGKERQNLADGIGVSVQAIGQVIAGKTKALTAENSAMAARYLGVDIYWLATGDGSPIEASNTAQTPMEGSVTPDEIIELIVLFQQATSRARSNILDFSRGAAKSGALRWAKVGHNET